MPHAKSVGFESVGRSGLSHPWLVGALAALGLVAGAGVGYVHPPSYTADAHLIVGRTSGLAEDQVPGLAASVQGLAADYARLITASNVVGDTLANLHSRSLGGTLTATPIPLSSIIDVQATASTRAAALRIANAGAAALVTVVTQVTNDSVAQLKPIIAEYSSADAAYKRPRPRSTCCNLSSMPSWARSATPIPRPSSRPSNSRSTPRSRNGKPRPIPPGCKQDVYLNQYNSALPPLQIQQEMVQPVGSATYSGNNRNSYIEAAGLGGLIGGLVLGLAGACLVNTRRGRRSLAANVQ